MDAIFEFTKLSGLQQLQAIFAGEIATGGIVKTLDLHLVSAKAGCVVFAGSPTQAFITRSAPCMAATTRPFSPTGQAAA